VALITEDGTAKTDAESYISVADADTYHSNRGNTAWAALETAAKEQSLRKGTDYMLQTYRSRWKGTRLTAGQALDWPREWVEREDYYLTGSAPPDSVDGAFYYPSDEVPVEVQRACAELALRASAGDLSPDIGRRTLREKVDVIEVEYDPNSPQYSIFRAVDGILAPLLKSGGSGVFRPVVRA
jgi:hypothetical protein